MILALLAGIGNWAVEVRRRYARAPAKITSGEYPRGSRIPTESELVVTDEIARSTARHAVAWLRDQKIIETVVTRGSYVL